MPNSQAFDVIVVGGGPGGAVAAKRCAEKGLTTLLIEKKKLPRDKVCTGMVMGDWAHDIIRSEFGEIPRTVLVDPPFLTGHQFHVAGTETQTLQWHTALAWRRDLDSWMVQAAMAAGVIVREGSPVVRVTSEQGALCVTTREEGITEELRPRFMIGADGGASVVRRSLFPELKVRYSAPIRECYHGALDLDRNFIHWFFPKARSRPRFNVNHKNDMFLVEGSGIKELRREIEETLGVYGFNPESKPARKDACTIALLHDQLLAGTFVPAEANALLVGDAAGLIFPITFEGIGSALKSGILAAESVAKSIETGRPASAYYLKGIEPIVQTIRRLCVVQNELKAISDRGPRVLADALQAAYRETLTIQSQ
jgi:flavin-dependent dehydrogenase